MFHLVLLLPGHLEPGDFSLVRRPAAQHARAQDPQRGRRPASEQPAQPRWEPAQPVWEPAQPVWEPAQPVWQPALPCVPATPALPCVPATPAVVQCSPPPVRYACQAPQCSPPPVWVPAPVTRVVPVVRQQPVWYGQTYQGGYAQHGWPGQPVRTPQYALPARMPAMSGPRYSSGTICGG